MANEILSEKVSVNINSSTLSSIDLLVDNGFYSNRSDFINQALRSALQQQQTTIDRLIEQNRPADDLSDQWFIGLYGINKKELQRFYDNQKTFSIRGYGVLVIDNDCPDDMVKSVIEKITVKGKISCSAELKKYYGLK